MGKNSKIEWTHHTRLPKTFAGTPIGRQLDGRTWDEFPEPHACRS